MSKTIMHALKISEISAVDRPAQAHAKAVIMKRADVRKDMYHVSNFASLLCSIGSLMQSSDYEAQREGDGSLVPQQLQRWLKSGAEIFQSMAAEEINEMLACINKREQEEEPYWKRKFSEAERKEDAKTGVAESDGSYPIRDAEDLHNAMQAYGRSKNKAKTKAHIRARAKALGLESELSDAFRRADGVVDTIKRATSFLAESVASILTSKTADKGALLEKTFDQFSDHLGNEVQKALAAGDAVASNGDQDMDPEIAKALGLDANAKPTDVIGAIAKMVTALKSTTGELAIAKAGMNEEEKAYHDGLDGDGEKEKFRGMSREERKAKMSKRDELPAHIRKVLEDNDRMAKRLAALEQKDERETISKRVADVGLGSDHVETVQKAYGGDRGAVDKLLDVVKALTAQVKAAGLFKELGDGRDGGGAGNDAYSQLMAKAEELQKRDASLTREQAFAKVYADPANADLAKRERAENRPQAA
ncbi:hypothetical protein [Bradyrhizobium sp.]|uniref:hypothetical protein n=1 Tax=Bradyrhizobium sp. TaxID=376 RepID=UPI001ED1EAB1|nr:hypothetical protein [Bradyrhizobium sp.]MBV9984518.1 hypothetical protein [Bradyrhizobium sp.]